MKRDKAAEIIDDLLNIIVLQNMLVTDNHIDKVQKNLLSFQTVKRALKYLKNHKGEFPMTEANSQWIKNVSKR